MRHQLGLDLPLPEQFWRYLAGLVQGNLGRSYIQRSEVATLIVARIPATLILMAAGIVVEVALGLTFGILAAVRRNGLVDRLVMTLAVVGVSSPQFVVALLLLYVFAATLGWFPMSGFETPAHVVLPALTLGLLGAGWYARMVRSAMIDVHRAWPPSRRFRSSTGGLYPGADGSRTDSRPAPGRAGQRLEKRR